MDSPVHRPSFGNQETKMTRAAVYMRGLQLYPSKEGVPENDRAVVDPVVKAVSMASRTKKVGARETRVQLKGVVDDAAVAFNIVKELEGRTVP